MQRHRQSQRDTNCQTKQQRDEDIDADRQKTFRSARSFTRAVKTFLVSAVRFSDKTSDFLLERRTLKKIFLSFMFINDDDDNDADSTVIRSVRLFGFVSIHGDIYEPYCIALNRCSCDSALNKQISNTSSSFLTQLQDFKGLRPYHQLTREVAVFSTGKELTFSQWTITTYF